MAQILDHLNRSGEPLLPELQAAMPLLRRRVPTWFESTRIHQDYHLGQAEALRRRPDFPTAL